MKQSPRLLERIIVDRNAGEIRLYETSKVLDVAPAPIVLPLSFVETGSVAIRLDETNADALALSFLAYDGVEIVPSAVPE